MKRKAPFVSKTFGHRLLRPALCAALLGAPAVTMLHATPAAAADPRLASPAEVQRATGHFVKGTELFKASRYAPALEEFKQSYGIVPSPNSHLYIARCLANLGQLRAAWLEFDRTAVEAAVAGGKYAQTRDSASQERDDLSNRLALVSVVVQGADSSASVRVGAYDVPGDRIGKPFPLEPGSFDVVLRVPGRPPVVQSISVRAGERRDVIVAPAMGGPSTGPVAVVDDNRGTRRGLSPLRIGAIAAGAVGVIGMIIFAVEGSASKSTFNNLTALCGGAAGCPSQRTAAQRATVSSDISSGNTQKTVANVGVAIGAIGLATGATLLALSFRRTDSGPTSGQLSVPKPGPWLDQLVVGTGWVGAKGTF